MCGGDPLKKQKQQAAQQQSQLASTLSGIATRREAQQTPFLMSRLQGGLPFREAALDFQRGTLARQFAPVRAAALRRLSQTTGLPSGFREQVLTDLDAQRARFFDDAVLRILAADEAARAEAASQLNPLGFFGGAQSGFASVLGARTQERGLAGILGGALSSLLGNPGLFRRRQ